MNTKSPFLTVVADQAVDAGASDIHLATGEPVYFRVDGQIQLPAKPGLQESLSAEQIEEIVAGLLDQQQRKRFQDRGSFDGAFSVDEQRFRFNAYRRRDEIVLAIRLLPDQIPTLEELGLHDELYQVSDLKDGLVLVAGPTGSGKSTTIAAFLDKINRTRAAHLITIEDPIEFLHRSQAALVNQRQVGRDVPTFAQALQDAVRQDPDVILVGELRDIDTIRTAITAAETGHLVFASVHAGDCKTAVERLVGSFPAEEQNLAQRLVATVLRTVIVQHLLPRFQSPNANQIQSTRRVLASEVMHVNSGIANLIANANLNQIASIIQTSGEEGMWTLDDSLARLWRSRLISEQTARSLARDPATLSQMKRTSRT